MNLWFAGISAVAVAASALLLWRVFRVGSPAGGQPPDAKVVER
jgi:hypothetical protein